jgi:hypothetical protein
MRKQRASFQVRHRLKWNDLFVLANLLKALSISVGALLVGCVPIRADVRYAEPAPAEGTAIIANQGNRWTSGAICQGGGSGGVCRAWLSAVDGKFPAYEANSVRVIPGEHAIKLGCNTSKGPLNMVSSFAAYHGTVKASTSYYVRCATEDGTARIWLSDSMEGAALPEFVLDPPDPEEEARIQKLPWYQRPVK